MFKQMQFLTFAALLAALVVTPVHAATELEDELAIGNLIGNFSVLWHQSDAHGLSMFWVADGDFLNPAGMMLRGRGQIEAFYAQAFKMGYAGSTVETTIERVHFLAPDLAIVDGEFDITGASTTEHKPKPAEHGYFTVIAQKSTGKWMVVSNREMEPPPSTQMEGVSGT